MSSVRKPSDVILGILFGAIMAALTLAWVAGHGLAYLGEALTWLGAVICSQSYKLAMMTEASQTGNE